MDKHASVGQAPREDLRGLVEILDALRVGACVLDRGGALVHVNSAGRRILGSAAATESPGPSGTSLADAFVQGTGQPYPADRLPFARALAGESCVVDDVEIRRGAERARLRVSAHPLRGAAGNVEYAVVTFSETSVRNSPVMPAAGEEQYRALFEQSPLMCFVVDPKGTVLRVNRQGAEELGYRPEELLGRSVLGVFLEEDHPLVLRHIATCLDDHASPQSWELRKIRKDGSLLWVQEFARAMKDTRGRPVVLISCENITERKRAEIQLRQTAEQLRALAGHLQSVREEERTRIARELHDELGQMLTGLKMDLLWLGGRLSEAAPAESPDVLRERTHAMSNLVDESIVAIRRLVAELRPAILDQLGLMDALEWLAQDFQQHSGIACEFITALPRLSLDRACTTALFRIVQEALTNVARHAGASRATIRLDEGEDGLRLVVEDDGKGIRPESISSHASFGLQGMRERATQMGGTITIEGRPGLGTSITARVPRRTAS